MKKNHPAAVGTLLLAILGSVQSANAQPQAGKLATRDELRACVLSETELATRREALQARNRQNNEEAVAIRAQAQELAEQAKAIEEESSAVGKRERFERRVKAHNARVKAAQDSVASLGAEFEALNRSLAAHNEKCGGITYRKEDKEAILKEREAAKKD